MPDRRYRIGCVAVLNGRATCDWIGGYRFAGSKEAAKKKPCPNCGGPVAAVEAPAPAPSSSSSRR
jgi:hypothetical protein